MIIIDQVKEAIRRAERRESNISQEALRVPGLCSLNIRHLLNNLAAISTRYLEIGVHRGGTFCSTISNNQNLKSATAIDYWQAFLDHKEGMFRDALIDFFNHVSLHIPDDTDLAVFKTDCFSDRIVNKVLGPVDLFFYDGDHSKEATRQGILHYLPVTTDQFILCLDDYEWQAVREGTQEAIRDSGVKVLFEQEFFTDHEIDNESWWNGFYVALLAKNKG